jgi:hypothetical protein
VDADRGSRAEWELVVTEEVEVEGKTAMDLYTTLDPACSLRVLSSSDGLGRPRGLSSHRQPITRIGNRGFPMRAFRLIFYYSKIQELANLVEDIESCSKIKNS